MKSIGLIIGYLAGPSRQRNTRLVVQLVLFVVALVVVFSVLFHVLMAREGQDHSWLTGFYWTLTVMSTLGFGDITFTSDAGRIFSVLVLITGVVLFLVLLPFVFIQFVFLPYVTWRDANRAPRRLPESVRDHIVIIGSGGVTDALIRRATDVGVPYVLLEPDPQAASAMADLGLRVMVGDIDSPDTYRAARVEHAALVAALRADTTNANIAFTVREMGATVPIVATATATPSADILQLAGCDEVLELGEVLGRAAARRVLGRDGRSQVIGEFAELRVAEAHAAHPDLVGHTLGEADVARRLGVNVAGVWSRGAYRAAGPATRIEEGAVLVLAGDDEQLAAFDAAFGIGVPEPEPVVVVGGGRVGRAAARRLGEAGVPCTIIEQRPERIRATAQYVEGDAADLEVLERAGLPGAGAVIITTHDDDVNVYLTIYCRRLRPDVQIIGRANLDRNVATLHRAGADAVLSYASLGASSVWNALGENDTLVVAEGLEVFQAPVPHQLVGRTLGDSGIREQTGCTVVAVVVDAHARSRPDAGTELRADASLVLIGDDESERRFLERWPFGSAVH